MSYNLVDPTTGDLTRVAGGTLYADNPIGSIIPFGSSIIPSGYLLCNGQAVSRTTYSELFAAIGTAFGTGNGSTTFNLPDMRESVPKGAGETGQTVGAHVKSGGLAVGEFLDDRVQKHTHLMGVMQSSLENGTSYSKAVINEANLPLITMENSGRKGDTTEVKSVGVNYIIKAKHVGIPADFIDAIDDAISDTTVDTVADGNMSPVTSNAVHGALNTVETTTVNLALSSTIESAYLPFYLKKTGKIVVANGLIQGITDWGTLVTDWGQIATIPSGFRPSSDIVFHILSADGSRVGVRVNATGVVQAYNYSGGGLGFEVSANCSWTIA